MTVRLKLQETQQSGISRASRTTFSGRSICCVAIDCNAGQGSRQASSFAIVPRRKGRKDFRGAMNDHRSLAPSPSAIACRTRQVPSDVQNLGRLRGSPLWLKPCLKHGGHIGHKPLDLPTSRLWDPRAPTFLIGDRNRVAVVNSHLTLEGAAKGLYLSAAVLRRRGHILIIDTRGEASPLANLVESSNHFIPASLSFSGSRWMGGSLTNWDSISGMVRRCAHISREFDAFLTENRIHIPRYERMRQAYPGFVKVVSPAVFNSSEIRLRFKRRPDLLWLVNPNDNRHIVQEAERLGIPTIGVMDSNTNPSNITIPIPVNPNTSFWSNKLIKTLLALSHQALSSTGRS